MSGTVLEFGPLEVADEQAFHNAIEQFALWREENTGTGWMQRDAPDVMIKTFCNANGELCKAVTFQREQWASTFMNFWRDHVTS